MLLYQIIIGTLMIILTVVIHAVALDRIMVSLEKNIFCKNLIRYKTPIIVVAVLGVFVAHTIEIWAWALLYLELRAIPDFEESLYFSTSSFTTLGFGDIILDKNWRFLSTLQGVNGFILFGWSTAFIFEIIMKLYRQNRDL
jgi:voltage-gated potassium channel